MYFVIIISSSSIITITIIIVIIIIIIVCEVFVSGAVPHVTQAALRWWVVAEMGAV